MCGCVLFAGLPSIQQMPAALTQHLTCSAERRLGACRAICILCSAFLWSGFSRSNRGNLIGTISAQPQLTSSSNTCKPWDISVAGSQINSRCSVGEAFPTMACASSCSSAGLFLASNERLYKNNANKKQHIFCASILNVALLS